MIGQTSACGATRWLSMCPCPYVVVRSRCPCSSYTTRRKPISHRWVLRHFASPVSSSTSKFFLLHVPYFRVLYSNRELRSIAPDVLLRLEDEAGGTVTNTRVEVAHKYPARGLVAPLHADAVETWVDTKMDRHVVISYDDIKNGDIVRLEDVRKAREGRLARNSAEQLRLRDAMLHRNSVYYNVHSLEYCEANELFNSELVPEDLTAFGDPRGLNFAELVRYTFPRNVEPIEAGEYVGLYSDQACRDFIGDNNLSFFRVPVEVGHTMTMLVDEADDKFSDAFGLDVTGFFIECQALL